MRTVSVSVSVCVCARESTRFVLIFTHRKRHSDSLMLFSWVGSITDSNGNHRLEGKRACASDYRILRKIHFERNMHCDLQCAMCSATRACVCVRAWHRSYCHQIHKMHLSKIWIVMALCINPAERFDLSGGSAAHSRTATYLCVFHLRASHHTVHSAETTFYGEYSKF